MPAGNSRCATHGIHVVFTWGCQDKAGHRVHALVTAAEEHCALLSTITSQGSGTSHSALRPPSRASLWQLSWAIFPWNPCLSESLIPDTEFVSRQV
jgi:hypothetical protein